MSKQICVAISLTTQEKSLVNQLAKQLQCSRTDLVQLALRQFLEKSRQEAKRS